MNVIKSTKVPDVIGVKAGLYDVCKDDKTFIEDRVDTIIDGIASVPTMETASPLVNATIGKCIDTVNECNEEVSIMISKLNIIERLTNRKWENNYGR